MSLAVVYREDERLRWLPWSRDPFMFEVLVPHLYDPNGRDGEWPAVVTMPHETVAHAGLAVPVFEGDVERRDWVPSTWTRTRPKR